MSTFIFVHLTSIIYRLTFSIKIHIANFEFILSYKIDVFSTNKQPNLGQSISNTIFNRPTQFPFLSQKSVNFSFSKKMIQPRVRFLSRLQTQKRENSRTQKIPFLRPSSPRNQNFYIGGGRDFIPFWRFRDICHWKRTSFSSFPAFSPSSYMKEK